MAIVEHSPEIDGSIAEVVAITQEMFNCALSSRSCGIPRIPIAALW